MSRSIYCGTRLVWLACLVAFAALPGFAQTIGAPAAQQISDILATKSSFTPAESKLSSGLAFGARLQGGILPSSVASAVSSPADANGMVRVDIRGTITPALENQIGTLGGQVTGSFPQFQFLQANVPLSALGAIAGNEAVGSIREADRRVVNRAAVVPSKRLRSRVLGPKGLAFVGSLTSQGYVTHQAQQVVNNYGFRGSGVKVGVLSDSASAARVAALIASGDLPANTVVLSGQDGGAGTDEGAAMMEIVSDLAPGAQLYFATADPSEGQMAANILALQAAGCSIIVDDVTYFGEGLFQDGTIAQAINTVVANGAVYISSASNSGNLTKGTSGTWEGDFLDDGPVGGPIGASGETGDIHNFGTVGSPQNFNVLTASTSFISLKWSDPLGGSTNDYDLFLLNPAGTAVTAFSAGTQSGTQDPYEIMVCVTNNTLCNFAANSRIVAVKFSGAARALHVDTERGQVSIKTSGATFGHNAAANAITAAATYWNSARTGTRPFTGFANTIETFSSDGPRKIFYNPDGSAITPGNFLFGTNGGTTLQKPDLTAADGTSARTPGFNPFFGTSAAAPHLAGIAALIESARPTLTNAQIRQVMIGTALDNMAVGPDRDGGYGIAMALAAVQAALLLP
jgi:hypothetical protein